MKKAFILLIVVAAIAACSTHEVALTPNQDAASLAQSAQPEPTTSGSDKSKKPRKRLAAAAVSTPVGVFQVAVGANGAVWVLGNNNLGGGNYPPYQYNPTTQTFLPLGGGASQIAVDPSGYAWAVNTYGNVYKSDQAAPNATTFNEVLPGYSTFMVAFGANGALWTLSTANLGGGNYPPYESTSPYTTLKELPGGASGIAVDPNGFGWAVNTYGNIYESNAAAPNATTFSSALSGYSASELSFGANDSLWLLGYNEVNGNYGVFESSSPAKPVIGVANFTATNVAADPSGYAWAVNSSGGLFKSNNAAPNATSFYQVPFPGPPPCNGDPTNVPTMPNSTFCSPVPSKPNVATNSSTIISYYAQNDLIPAAPTYYDWDCCSGFFYQFGAQGSPPPTYANRSDIYLAAAGDQDYTIIDTGEYGEATPPPNTQIPIPAGAEPQGYTTNCPAKDEPTAVPSGATALPTSGYTCTGGPNSGEGHMAIIDQAGNEWDFYRVYQIGGGTITAADVTEYPLSTTNGWGCETGLPASICKYGSSTGEGRALSQGLVSPQELINGRINHALSFSGPCTSGTPVSPGIGSDSPCGSASALGGGQKIFLSACSSYPSCTINQSLTTIESWNVPAQTKIVLAAMANYGMYYTDSSGGSPSPGGPPTNGDDWYIETIDYQSYNSAHHITNNWPAFAAQFSPSPYPTGNGYGGLNNYGYDFDFRAIPTNNSANAPAGATGLWSWMAVCSSNGC